MNTKISLVTPGKLSRIPNLINTQFQIDLNNLNNWRIEAPSQMLKALNKEAAEDDDRYRNTPKPFPLL
jgi:hypothetical protein